MKIPAGSTLTGLDITGRNASQATFVPDESGKYEIDLALSDEADTTHEQIIITAEINVPPTAKAGLDQVVLLGQSATLDGSGSYDQDGRPQPIAYLWSFISLPGGSSLTNDSIVNPNSSRASFIPDMASSYVLQLALSDGQSKVTDNMVVIAEEAGREIDTSISSQPSNPSNSTSATFNFTSTESASTFQCQLDGGSYSTCTSPKSYTGLVNGSHTFNVKATDSGGNTDPTPASYTWTVDTIDTEAISDITVTPVTFPFGNVNIGSNSERTVSVRNDGNANMVIGTITDPSSPFSKVSDGCSGQTLSPSAGCTITIKFSPKSTETFTSSVNIPSNDPDENPVTISLTGAGASAGSPDITVLPSLDLSFPNISVGVTADQTITVKNEGTSDLIISSIVSPQAPFSIVAGADNCSNHTLTPNQSCTIKVRFTPAASGTFNSTLIIPSNDPDENPVTVSLNGSATTGTNNLPTKPNLAEPANGAIGMPTTLTLKWEISTDADGDPVTYRFYIGIDPGFADVSPKILASASDDNNSAMAMRYSIGIIGLLGMIAIGRLSSNRKKMGIFFIVIIMVTGFIFTSCGSGGGGDGNNNGSDNKNYKSYTINLQPSTTYYWKVVADDGKGGVTESDTYSFTTGR